jgi:hypothetical protein
MNSERRINSRPCLLLTIAILAVIASPALAQSVGGPNKPINHIGGATTHPNPVIPPAKGVTANAAPSNPTKQPNPTLAKKPPNPALAKSPPTPTLAKGPPTPTLPKKK